MSNGLGNDAPLTSINSHELFEIGSALRTSTPDGVVEEDCKEFTERDIRFLISQIEETGFDLFWERKDESESRWWPMPSNTNSIFSPLITDVVSNGSLLLLSKEMSVGRDKLPANRPRTLCTKERGQP